ncbi:major histocompatibility complex class I-related gene protein-like isoform X2 [Scophthalmus maximus]|uniref:major histocompatibility complex class I-related gene protein-like isoform X2 n=1 Tax=Scophthalmus maximus TaxID=52904 RepID=UPI001FA88C62|nr:major histocompatibility complex class I-related gene protein-like isoform X2 [Scophthalmus maximus]
MKPSLLLLLLLLCGVSSPAKHSLKFFLTASSGLPDLPQFVGVAVVNGVTTGSCDTTSNMVHVKQAWVKRYVESDPQHLQWYTGECFQILPYHFKAHIDMFRQRFNQSEGVHIIQWTNGCEWDEETGEVNGFMQNGYDGEDYIALDLKTQTWIASKPQAVVTKLLLDADKGRMKQISNFYTQICPKWLRGYLEYGKSSLLRTELPSVSLLQKSPSSPVSCHATGFYPDRAVMFWRKDGEELHEDVDVDEILPNHDGTFQMSVELHISPVAPEDWGRYDCVFRLSGVKEDIVIKLDEAVIRTNRVKPSNTTVSIVIVVLVVLVVVSAAVLGFIVYKKKKVVSPPPQCECVCDLTAPDSVSMRLNPEE